MGVTGGCWREYTGSRWERCGSRSSRLPQRNSCGGLLRVAACAPGSQVLGDRGTLEILQQMQGFEAPANSLGTAESLGGEWRTMTRKSWITCALRARWAGAGYRRTRLRWTRCRPTDGVSYRQAWRRSPSLCARMRIG